VPDNENLVAHLREQAAKCRVMAERMTQERDASSLRQLASEYDKGADELESRVAHPIPIALPPLTKA